MLDDDDWDFVGDADAKGTIHAAVRYLLKSAAGGDRATWFLKSSRSCAKPRRTFHLTDLIHSMMVMRPADSPRHGSRKPAGESGSCVLRTVPVSQSAQTGRSL
jgi:hypothetical protein